MSATVGRPRKIPLSVAFGSEKQCGGCLKVLPLEDFGIANHRPDGRNFYCKACVRNQVYAARERKREREETIFWVGVKRARYVEMIEWLEDPMVCSDCMEWFSVKSRTPKVCRECESKAIARAAKQVDENSLSIASLAAWLQSGQPPMKRERVWKAI